jgi:type I restriction enzyme S subunit
MALGDVCQIKPPKSEARNRVSTDGLVSFLPMEDIGIDEKYVRATQTKPLSAVVGSYTYFADGDVLLAKITPCFENGKLGIAEGLTNGIGFGSSEYIVFRPDGMLSKEWLYYYLSRESFRVEGAARMSGAVGHKRVSKEFIESYPIPIPPLPEQLRIVGILDEAFDGIATAKANAEKNLQNARALFESHLQAVFTQRGEGWVDTTIGQCIRFIDYRGKTPVKTESGLRLITAKNVKMGYLQETPMEFIAPESYDGWMTRGIPNMGDVLFTTEAPLANVAQLDTDEKVAFAQRVIIMQPEKSKLDSTFLKYLLLSNPVQQRIRAKGTGATVQ